MKINTIIYKALSGVIFIMFLGIVHAQTIRDFNKSIQSPTATSFGLFNEMPVSLFTGLPQVEVPVYNLNEGDLTVPIKLSYHASGFRPDIKPGSIAPNWALVTGGVIERKVHDRPDDMNYTGFDELPSFGLTNYEVYNFNYSGYYFNRDTLRKVVGNKWGQLSVLNDLAFPTSSALPLTNTLLGYRDTESDEYSFNFPGGSGKFYLDTSGNWVVESDQEIEVELTGPFLAVPFKLPVTNLDKTGQQFTGAPGNNWRAQYGSYKTFGGFTITDASGIKYIFGSSSDYIEYSIDMMNQDRDFWQADAWYLKQIIHPNGNVVDFQYERHGFSDQLSDYEYWNISTNYNNTNTSIWNFLGAIACGGSQQSIQSNYAGRLLSPLYLSVISTSNKKIKFNYSFNGLSRYAATWVDPGVLSFTPNPYAQILSYYFQNGNQIASRQIEPNGTADFPYYYNTLAFPYLVEYYRTLPTTYTTAGTIPYNFTYSDFAYFYASFLEDYRLNSISIYNNLNPASQPLPVGTQGHPTVLYVDSSLLESVNLGYTTSANSSNRYNLTSVTFKTGGDQKINAYLLDYFPFDENCYYFARRTDHWGFYTTKDIYNVTTDDRRDNQTKYYNARNPSLQFTQMNMLKSITYPTGGRTEFEYELNSAYYSVDKSRTSLNVWNKDVGGLRIKKLTFYPLLGSPNTKSFYYVTNFGTTLTQKSSGVLAYEPQYLFKDFRTKAAQGDVYVTKTIFTTNSLIPAASTSQGSHIGYSEVAEENTDGSYIRHYFTNFDNGHMDQSETALIADLSPYNPFTSKEMERGKEYKTESYNSDKKLINKTETQFINLNPNSNTSTAIYVERNKLCTGEWYESTAKYYTNYTYSVLPTVEKTTEYVYRAAGTDSLTVSKSISYYNHKNIKDITTTNSKGESIKTEFKYSVDLSDPGYSDAFGQAINALANKHIIVPLEKVTSKNGVVQQSEIYEYKLYDGINNPPQLYKEYKWNTLMSSTYSRLQKSGTTVQKNAVLDEVAHVDSYNGLGRPTQIVLKGKDTISYVWGVYNKFPLAALDGVPYQNILNQLGTNVAAVEQYFLDTASYSGFEADIRTAFKAAHINFYTFNTVGLLSKISPPNEQNSFYCYDEAYRLSNVFDNKKYIIKHYEYNPLTRNNDNFFTNAPQSATFYRGNCLAGLSGSGVLFTIPSGTCLSTVSQTDADNQALQILNQYGQVYANEHGSCTLPYASISYENLISSGTDTYGDVVVDFFSDANKTYPVSVTNLDIHYSFSTNCPNIPIPVGGTYNPPTSGGDSPVPVGGSDTSGNAGITINGSGNKIILAQGVQLSSTYQSDCIWVYIPPSCPDCPPGQVSDPDAPGGDWVQLCGSNPCSIDYVLLPGDYNIIP